MKLRYIPPRLLQRIQQVEKLAKDAFGKQIGLSGQYLAVIAISEIAASV